MSGGRNVVDTSSARGQRLRVAYCRDHVMNCLAGCGGVRSRSDPWVASPCRWRLFVNNVARWSCFDCRSSAPFLSAVRTISGLPLRSVKDAASCIDADPENSSMKLPRWRAVEELARASSRDRASPVIRAHAPHVGAHGTVTFY